ncbi:MAG: riboflavin biosynthesis protein RibF [Acidimicrobiia bacterium]|nr:riboflavin biosynthesis protein RibF [Acidimicrobiia bacterium]NNF09382.1 riboflavin biosynthesis protein RibF [Acidimicrobiia bacterium]NNL71179.1 riboflavin biosynthesis protein RibF [Acidimicrobiia bacterium]
MKLLVGDPGMWEPPAGGVAVSIGVFDGVHLGHLHMLQILRDEASGLGGLPVGAVTFDRHPLTTIAPERVPPLITTPDERLARFEVAALDFAAVLTFEEKMRSLTADDFVRAVLADGLGARLVVVGDGFRFGLNAAGDVDGLRRLGDHFGFAVRTVQLLENEAGPVSSSAIRAAVADGDVAGAAPLLGRHFSRTGLVVAGDHRGAGIGFPTANLRVRPGLLLPGGGVYAAFATVDAHRRPAVVNIGVRPTFDGSRQVVEAHLLDYSGDLYGQELTLEFVARLRAEERFESVGDLVAQIGRDVDAARRLLQSP